MADGTTTVYPGAYDEVDVVAGTSIILPADGGWAEWRILTDAANGNIRSRTWVDRVASPDARRLTPSRRLGCLRRYSGQRRAFN